MMAWKNVREATETREAADDRVVRLGTDIQKWIADRLRETLEEYIGQGVPAPIAALIREFDDPKDEGK
jgi:hypothetical protein